MSKAAYNPEVHAELNQQHAVCRMRASILEKGAAAELNESAGKYGNIGKGRTEAICMSLRQAQGLYDEADDLMQEITHLAKLRDAAKKGARS